MNGFHLDFLPRELVFAITEAIAAEKCEMTLEPATT